MKASIRVNNDLGVDTVIALAVAAEESGIDQIWVSHDLFQRSAAVLLATAAQRTTRTQLGIGIANPYTWHPAEIAMFAATMQEASGGRFLLGLSAGAGDFLSWVGISQDRPLTRTAEATRAIRTLLNGGRPAGQTRGWTKEAYLRTGPAPTPLYIGAMSPKMLHLAGAEGDGVLPLLFPPEHLATARDYVNNGIHEADRDPADVDLAACFWCSIDEDPEAARLALAHKLAYYGPSFSPYLLQRAGIEPVELHPLRDAVHAGQIDKAIKLVDNRLLRLGIAGDVEQTIARCCVLVRMGATHLSFGPPLGPDPIAAVRLIGEHIMPAVRSRLTDPGPEQPT